MVAPRPGPAIRIAPAVILATVCLAAAVLVVNMDGEGPSSRCEAAGGQMLVGPGGETACVSGRTFLPIDGFDARPASR